MRLRNPGLLFFLLVIFGCSAGRTPETTDKPMHATARVISEGYFECFEKGLKDEDGDEVSCEISAVAYAGGQLVLGNDKTVPGGSPMTTVPWTGSDLETTPSPVETSVSQTVRKLEAATTTPDGQWVLAATAFDRVHGESAKWNPYNTLLFWPAGHPEQAQVAHASTVDGYLSSIDLRAGFQQALADDQFPEGPPYFKLEAMTAVPGNRLLFGAREVGMRYDDFHYVARILSVNYRIENDELVLSLPLRKVYEVDLEANATAGMITPLGISSLEYDSSSDRLFLLTSFEIGDEAEDMGAYLWVLPMADFTAGNSPSLILGKDGQPFLFAHKAEGLAVIDASTLIVVHDDDRVTGEESISDPTREFDRRFHQAAWTVVGID